MLVGDRFFPETFYMNKIAVIFIAGIALAAHATGTMLVQTFKIVIDDFLCFFLAAGGYRKGHDIPYHNAYSFGETAGYNMAFLIFKTLHPLTAVLLF